MNNTFYLTTTLPYVNADPHIGFALEIVAGDVISRYQKILGKSVIFNTGTDEHGQKIYQQAIEAEKSPQDYVDSYAQKFADLEKQLNLDSPKFIRTTDPDHVFAAQEFWKICEKNGDIYKKMYKTTYCVGCELEKQASDLENGKCPLHPNKVLEIIEEENYFFKFSKFQQDLLNLYEADDNFVKPEGKLNEIKSFVSRGLTDFSISRLKTKMPWGIPVPSDEEHVMYVWFDALVNYISTLGWPKNIENFNKYWPAVQIAGKDNLRQQAAMWQAMLMSAKLPNSREILINGFISVDGQKMSKSLGNVISPQQMIDKYGIDASRYLLMNLGPIGTDMDVSWEKFDTTYTADLSNGLGNLCSRVAKMCEKNNGSFNKNIEPPELSVEFQLNMNHFDLKEALQKNIVSLINAGDQFLSETKPWTKNGEEQQKLLQMAVSNILLIAKQIEPFMPETSITIYNHFSQEKITAIKPLFPRLG